MRVTRSRNVVWSVSDLCGGKGWYVKDDALNVTDSDVERWRESIRWEEAERIFNPDKKRVQHKIRRDDPVYMGMLTCLASEMVGRVVDDAVLVRSFPGCRRQKLHTDYDPTLVERAILKPIGVLVALEAEGADVHIRAEGGDSVLHMERGQILVFDGDVVHAGAAYERDNIRLHAYFDTPEIRREKNTTYFV